MKPLLWNAAKNKQLRAERGIDFDAVALAINQGLILDVIEHPNQEKYPSQKIFVLAINQYVYLVPFIEDEHAIFLKTIIPSRKMEKISRRIDGGYKTNTRRTRATDMCGK